MMDYMRDAMMGDFWSEDDEAEANVRSQPAESEEETNL